MRNVDKLYIRDFEEDYWMQIFDGGPDGELLYDGPCIGVYDLLEMLEVDYEFEDDEGEADE